MKENKMKPRRNQRHTAPTWQGKGVGAAGDKAKPSQAKPALLMSPPAQVKPFAGKVFYLDLPSNRTAETLERDIKELGGTVEKFFSKEIKYLVSNKREARYVHCLRQDSPVPSPDSGQSSPHPRSKPHRPGDHGDNIKGQTDTFVTSRGKSLVERVVKEQKRVQMNKILSNALEWGVKILYIDDIMAYVQKKKKVVSSQRPATTAVKTSVKAESVAKQGFQKCKGGRISKPFVKVEDSSRHYRPIYLTMPNMPEFNLQSVAPGSPFCVEDKDPPGNKQRGHSEERANGRKKNRDKKRSGYCECCMIKYENVTAHLQSERHKTFSKSDKYLSVDKLVSTLHCNFIHIRTQVKRRRCSVSSVLIAPGPCGETELRHRGDLNTTDIIKEEQHRTVDGHEGSYSGHTSKIGSLPASPPLIHREGDRRSCNTHSDSSKHKYLPNQRPCRQNSSTSKTQRARQARSLQPEMETAPSGGLTIVPSRVPQTDTVDQIITDYMNSSTSQNMNVQTDVSLKSLNAVTNQQESVRKQNSSVLEAVQDGNASPNKMTENNFSENEEASVPTQSTSPVRKIQRRVRVYKRKRRKVDPHVEHTRQSLDNSLIRLGEIFQSSDDMDVEFLGFADEEGTNELKE
ncbi:protein DBF4 homolog A [Larimichthys crocea]|uniref:protein DBF4 homolog A n=1 Tax=Larimichthys crocea TaxID=215358 RepID=UPI000F6005ED|nr:protein DBF4 homolog A [Larimichthys crocea]XP_027142739.1 protein DBF4 homolog A [Larimichthys crocea]XP_027142740.1 protein DBF4 homolog A [Larimichthys crocea]